MSNACRNRQAESTRAIRFSAETSNSGYHAVRGYPRTWVECEQYNLHPAYKLSIRSLKPDIFVLRSPYFLLYTRALLGCTCIPCVPQLCNHTPGSRTLTGLHEPCVLRQPSASPANEGCHGKAWVIRRTRQTKQTSKDCLVICGGAFRYCSALRCWM